MQILFSNTFGYIKTASRFGVLTGMFNGVKFDMHYTCFFLLHKKLNAFNIHAMLDDLSAKPDCNLIKLEQGKCKINCNLHQLIALKTIFNGAMFYIRLQDELYKKNISFSQLCENEIQNLETNFAHK